MPRTRTTKKLAQRIDLNYFKRPAPLLRWKFWLSVAAPALALALLGWHTLRGDARVYSAGALAPGHALLTSRCEVCHVRAGPGKGPYQTSGGFSARASDAACLACHDGPPHHASAAFMPSCGSCHEEHRGAVRLAATADAACTQCHADLHTRTGTSAAFVHDPVDRQITGFTSLHPEFAVLRNHSVTGGRSGSGDPTTIKLNHFRHMQPNLKGPNGPVQLACGDCHHAAGDPRAWPYAAAAGAISPSANGASSTGAAGATSLGASATSATALAGPTRQGRAYLAAPTYASACAGCHTLEFDKRFAEGVPHDKPEVVHAFLVQKFRSYIAAHPAELHEPRQPDRDLPGQPVAAAYRNVTPAEWVAERTGEAEELLWRKTCLQCHALDFAAASQATRGAEGAEPPQPAPARSALPTIAPSNLITRFMPHARFDHGAHEFLKCESCHAKALSSQASADLLLPGIATCRQCHRPSSGNAEVAESRCFECHTYHDESQRKPAPGRLTLPELGLRPASLSVTRSVSH